MKEFTEKPVCEKCGNDVACWTFKSSVTVNNGITSSEIKEWIDLRCIQCRYIWVMEVKTKSENHTTD